MKYTVYTTVKSGKIEKSAVEKISQAFHFLNDKQIEVVISELKPMRSDPQRRFYFGPFIESQLECFNERLGEILNKTQVHEFNKSNFFAKEVLADGGEILKIPQSTNEFDTMNWETALERVRQFFLINFEWTLPVPNELPTETRV